MWPAHGEHLIRVAQELAQAAEQLDDSASVLRKDNALRRNEIVEDAIATLEQAFSAKSGAGELAIDVADFRCLEDHPRFKTLLISSK